MALLDTTKAAIEHAVNLINEIGVTCYYTRQGETISTKLKVLMRELGTTELVGDYRQGDLKVEVDASALSQVPAKYDTLLVGDYTYTIKDGKASPRRVGDTVYTYKFVVRGG